MTHIHVIHENAAWLEPLARALDAEGRDDILIVVGGVIPPHDRDALLQVGASAIFPPGTNIPEAAHSRYSIQASSRISTRVC